MKLDDFAYTAAEKLAVVNLKIESAKVMENHRYKMPPVIVERFVYIIKGSVCFSVENKEIYAHTRDMVYLPRNTAYHSHWLEKSEFVVVDISLCHADGNEISFGDMPDILFSDEFCVYDGLLKLLADKAEETDPFNWLERTSLCLKLLCDMARDTKKPEREHKNQKIRNAIIYLENNYAKDFTVDHLAKLCFLSPTIFRRMFFESTGRSPVDYRNTLRIQHAAEFLKSGKYNVSEVAEKVGINDIKYFGKLFLRYTGTTPGAFKKLKN